MTNEDAAHCMTELGSPARLETFKLLIRAGPAGLQVNEIQDHLDIPASTLSHHLGRLVSCGLVKRVREGRVLRTRIDYERVNALLTFLKEDCCAGIERHADVNAVTGEECC